MKNLFLYIHIYIYMFIEVSADGFYVIRDFSGISAWVWEFYSALRLSFWSHFQEGGWVVYVVLASLSRVRFGECLLSEFLQSEHLVGWEVQEVWSILRLRVEYLQLCGWRLGCHCFEKTCIKQRSSSLVYS